MMKRTGDKVHSFYFRSGLPVVKNSINNIYYFATAPVFFYNKTRRFVVSRSKAMLKRKKNRSVFWVNLGRLVFFFKKAINSRMGKGVGSFYSVRRWVGGGSCLFWYKTSRFGLNNAAFNYLIARFSIYIRKYVLAGRISFLYLAKKILIKNYRRYWKSTLTKRSKIKKNFRVFYTKRHLLSWHVSEDYRRRKYRVITKRRYKKLQFKGRWFIEHFDNVPVFFTYYIVKIIDWVIEYCYRLKLLFFFEEIFITIFFLFKKFDNWDYYYNYAPHIRKELLESKHKYIAIKWI